jgi:P4 family phage/plasmid primase-like protien
MSNWTTPVGAAAGAGMVDDGETCSVITSTFEEGRRVSSAYSAEEIAEAYKIARQCLNPEKRAGRYTDWINLAILLRNISNTDESFNVWMEISRRVPGYDGRMTDAEYRAKWNSVRVDNSKRLTMGSLMYWAEDDAPETLKAIKSETNRDWIMNYAKDTHVNVASFVVRMYSHQFRCSIGSKRGAEWFYYNKDNHSWRHLKTPNELRARLSGEVRNQYIEADREFGRRIQLAINNESEGKMNEEKRKKILQIERQLEMASFKDNVLKECAEKFYDEDFVSRLNCNPYIVGVANGVLELDWQDPVDKRYKVRFRDGLPEDMISFQMGRSEPDLDAIPYIPWSAVDVEDRRGLEGFFERIYPDSVLRNYVLTLLSSCLEGQNREQRFYIMQGRGSNGKSMIQTLMRYTFGDYQTSLQTTALTRKRPESGAANPDMIVTKCKRYIYMGEPDQNEKINTARMKQLSGEDIVEARGLFSDQEKFKMMGKMFLACNDLPPVSSMDDGTWRRIVTIPHLATFVNPGKPTNPEANIYVKDLHLEQKLRKWRTAFLSLLVHYYESSYLVGGLQEPDCVTAASNKYKQDNDSFAAFLSDNFVLEPGAGPVSINTVKEIYKEWDRTQLGRAKLVQKQIVERLRSVCDRRSTEREFWGIRQLNPDEETQNVDGASIGSLASL